VSLFILHNRNTRNYQNIVHYRLCLILIRYKPSVKVLLVLIILPGIIQESTEPTVKHFGETNAGPMESWARSVLTFNHEVIYEK
jgi:hypothetical protein